MMHIRTAAISAAVVFTLSLSSQAIAQECTDGMQMTISGTVSSIKDPGGGLLQILLTEQGDCKIWGVVAKAEVFPPDCKAGQQFEATGLLETFLGYIATLKAETVDCY